MSIVVGFLEDHLMSLSLFFMTVLVARWLQTTKRSNMPPGPRGWPFIGNLLLMLKPDKRAVFRELREKYGDLVSMQIGGRSVVVVNGTSKLHEVFVGHGKLFDKRPQVFTVLKVGQGKGVINTSNEVWKEHRTFLLTNLNDLGIGKTIFQDNVTEEIQLFLEVIDQTKGHNFDPCYAIQTAMSNIICAICFGKRFEYTDPEFKEILNIFDSNMRISGSTAVVNFFPFLEYLPGDPFKCKAVLENVEKIQKKLRVWIQKHKDCLNMDDPRDIIDRYLVDMDKKHCGGRSTNMDDSQLLKFIGDLFVGGTETTATTLRWALLFLVHHQEVQQKIYDEIVQTLDGRSHLSIIDKTNMPFTQAAILECQRLGDIAPFSLPHSNEQSVNIGHYTIPPNCVVIPNLNSVHHDPDIWEDPMEFKPTRFLDSNGCFTGSKDVMAFSIGPRLCPGKSLGKMEIFLFLTSVILHYEVLPDSQRGAPPLEGNLGITYVPLHHNLRFVRRSHSNSQEISQQ